MDDVAGLHLRSRLLACGYTSAEVQRARRTRRLHDVRRGAYVDPDDERLGQTESRHRLLIAATAPRVAADAAVSHVSAAVLRGLHVWTVPLAKVHVPRDATSEGGSAQSSTATATAPLPVDVSVSLSPVSTRCDTRRRAQRPVGRATTPRRPRRAPRTSPRHSAFRRPTQRLRRSGLRFRRPRGRDRAQRPGPPRTSRAGGLFELGEFAYDMQELLGVFTEVVTVDGLKARLRARVLSEAIPV